MADGPHTIPTRVALTATFERIVDGERVFFDPTALTLRTALIVSPRLKKHQHLYTYPTSIEIVRDDLGKFRFELLMTEAGKWKYVWKSTGLGEERTFVGEINAQAEDF